MPNIGTLPPVYPATTERASNAVNSTSGTGEKENFDSLGLEPRPSQPFLYPGDLHETQKIAETILAGMNALARRG